MFVLHQYYLWIIGHIRNIFSFKTWKLLWFGFSLNLNLNSVWINTCLINDNRGDVAPLAWGHCSLIIRVSQISSTTRNLVPRFKRGVRGKAGYDILTDLLGLCFSSWRVRSTALMSSSLYFMSSWWSCHPFFKNSIVLTKG